MTKYRLQTTIDFPIHLSYKTSHLEALYKILESSNTISNHSIGTLLKNFHYEKNEKVLRTMVISERHVIDRHLSDNQCIKKHVSFYLPLVLLFDMIDEFIIFPTSTPIY